MKSRSNDLYYCENLDCKTVTFITANGNECPNCNKIGRVIRTANSLAIAEAIEKGKKENRREYH